MTASYLPRIGYSTRLDTYITICLLFSIAAIAVVVGIKNMHSTTARNIPFQAYHGEFDLDKGLWAGLGVLWLLVNIYFSQFFLGKYAETRLAIRARHEKREARELGAAQKGEVTAIVIPPVEALQERSVPAAFDINTQYNTGDLVRFIPFGQSSALVYVARGPSKGTAPNALCSAFTLRRPTCTRLLRVACVSCEDEFCGRGISLGCLYRFIYVLRAFGALVLSVRLPSCPPLRPSPLFSLLSHPARTRTHARTPVFLGPLPGR